MFLKIHSRFETFDICLWGRNLQIILVGNTEENSYHTSSMPYTVSPDTTLFIAIC